MSSGIAEALSAGYGSARDADALARERALDPARSIILEAPAGSGKTSVLTHRFLRLLAEVGEPEEILAVTFTRKAAAEMRTRVLEALAREDGTDLAADDPVAVFARAARRRSAARGWDLEAHPGRLRIQTIDALSRALAAHLPVAARATIGFELAERASALYRHAARRTLLDAESDPGLLADLERLLERLDNDAARAERLFATMLSVRAHWLPLILRGSAHELPSRVMASLASLTRDRAKRAEQALPRALLAEGMRLVLATARHSAAEPPSAAIGAPTLADWRRLARIALTERGEWRRVLTVRDGFPLDAAALKAEGLAWIAAVGRTRGAREVLAEMAALPDASLTTDDEETLRSLARLLRLAASELEIVFAENGRVDHAYVAAAARRALTEEGAPTEVSLRVGQQLRHILVDEFQDTSAGQVELLRALTAGWQPGDGRSLFLVGDPMQSIYLFRQADVGLFLSIAEHGLGELRLERLTLAQNFRAATAIVEWLNAAFVRILPDASDACTGAIAYRSCVAGRRDPAGGRVEVHRLSGGDNGGEARTVVQIVRRVWSEHPTRRVAVLVAARPHAVAVTKALREARIPVLGVDLVPLGEVAVVRDLAALARALDHLGDRTSWLAVLRAPWCGLTLRELTVLFGGEEVSTVWEAINDPDRTGRLPNDAQVRLERLRAGLAGASDALAVRPFAEVLEDAWMRFGGPAACVTDMELEHAARFFGQLAVWSGQPDWTGTEDLTERLGSLFAEESAAAGQAVQIMTIHRAKGLEFDVVILPGLGRMPRTDTEPLLRWLELPANEGGGDLLVAPLSARGLDAEPLNAYLKLLRRERLANERARLAYVAATRARSELHLLCDLPAPVGSTAPTEPRAGSLLATLWPAVGAQLREATARSEPGPWEASEAWRQPSYRLRADWQPPAIAGPSPARAFAMPKQSFPAPDFAWATQAARSAGRVVHELLQEFGRLGQSPDRGAVLDARDRIGCRLMQLGLSRSELPRAQTRAVEGLLACAIDPRGRWIFAPEHQAVASPLELSGVVAGRLESVSIDRSFIDAGGIRWLIDFKIGIHQEPDVDAFVASELERYRPQLARAAALASRLGPEPVRVGLYFPLLKIFREIG